MTVHLRKYGAATRIPFQLYLPDASAFKTDATFVAGDIRITKDEGAEADLGTAAVDEGTGYSVALTATEMQAARISGYVVDLTGTKVWLDTGFYIETYGNASAQHAFDLDTATQDVNAVQISGDSTAADNLELMYDGTGYAGGTTKLDVNAVQISGDSTAADNLELQYDTTGYTDDTAPASRAQVAGLGAASGGALNFANEGDNIDAPIKSVTFVGVESSGTNASVNSEDASYHQITHSANVIDIVYQYDIGGSRTATEVTWAGKVVGNNDIVTLQAYNGSTWDNIVAIDGSNGAPTSVSDNGTTVGKLLTTHTGTGADLGKVFIRAISSSTGVVLYTDSLLVSAVASQATIGYIGGAVWLDTGLSNTNTESFVDGTADNPVSTLAAARTIMSNLNLKILHSLPGTSITLASNSDNLEFIGANYSIGGGSQSIEGATFHGAGITGIFTATVTRPTFADCTFGTCTIPPCVMNGCSYGDGDGLFTAGSAGEYVALFPKSVVAGSGTPDFKFDGLGSATGINWRGHLGGSTWTLDSDCTLSLEVLAGGGQTITTGGANVEARGTMRALTVTMSATETVQFVGVTGPIAVSGTTTGTVNLYGVASSVADTTSGATTTDKTTIKADTENIEADTQDIQTRLPAALSSGNMKADLFAISTSAQAADNLEASALSIVKGTVNTANVASSTTTFQADDITETTADHFIGRTVMFYDSGDALFRQATDILDYEWDAVNSEARFTTTQLTESPSDDDLFVII